MLANPARLGLALALAALIGTAAVRGADDKIDGDLKKIQGKWSVPSSQGGKVTYTIEGDKLKVVAPTRSYAMTLKLDESAKPEKTIDFQIDEGPDDSKGKTSKGIYKFEDDKFVFCFAPEGDRPAKYEMEGYEKIVVKLARDKN